MDRRDVEQEVLAAIVHQIGESPGISRRSHLREDLAVDSMEMVSILLELEDRFDVTITTDEAERIETVGDLIVKVKEAL